MPHRRSATLVLLLLALLAGIWSLIRLEPDSVELGRGVGADEERDVERSPISAESKAESKPTPPKPADARTARRAPDPTPRTDLDVAPTLARLRGNLIDVDQLPVAGARIYAVSAPTLGAPYDRSRAFAAHLPLDVADPERLGCDVPFTTTSDARGKFTIDGLAPGRVRLCIVPRDHVRIERDDLVLFAGEDRNLRDVHLAPGPRVRLFVRDQSGNPIANAELLERDGAFEAELPFLSPRFGRSLGISDGEGRLESVPLGPRWHSLALWHPDHGLATFLFDTDDPRTPNVALPNTEIVDVFVAPGERDSLPRIVRALDVDAPPSPIDFELRADAREATCDEEQRARISGLVRGRRYELRASPIDERWEQRSPWNLPQVVVAGTPRVALPYLADGRIAFSLTDGETPRVRLAGAMPEFPALKALGGGRWELGGIRPLLGARATDLELRADEFGFTSAPLQLVSGAVNDLGKLTRAPLPHARVVVVHRDDTGTRVPLAGAIVEARPVPRELNDGTRSVAIARTGSDGEARIATWGLPNTAFLVRAEGFPPQGFAAFQPTKEREPKVELALSPGRACRVRVRDADGAAIRGARVELEASLRDGFPLELLETLPPEALTAEREHPSIDLARLAAKRWDLERRADGSLVAVTDVNGVARFDSIAPDRASVVVQRHAVVRDGERASAEETVELASLRRTSFVLRVTRGPRPVGDAALALFPRPPGADLREWLDPSVVLPPALHAHTGGGGDELLEDLSPGTFVAAVQLPWQRWRALASFTLRESTREVILELAEHSLSGGVVDEDGKPVRGAGIQAWIGERTGASLQGDARELLAALQRDDESARRTVITTNERGMFQLLGLPPELRGALRAITNDGRASPWVRFEAGAPGSSGDEPAIELRVRPAGSLVVHAAEDSSRTDALLLLERADAVTAGETLTARCASRALRRGSIANVEGLTPGSWRVTLATPRQVARVETLTISPWAAASDLERANVFDLEALATVEIVAGEVTPLEVVLR